MTSDQLSDSLFKEASIAELKEKARIEGDKQTLQQYEQMEIQKQVEQLVLRLQSAFISIAAHLTPIFKGFEFMMKNAEIALGAFAGMKIASFMLANNFKRAAMYQAMITALKNPAAAAIGAIAGAGIAYGIKTMVVDDLMIPPGGATHVTGPAGHFQLNPRDGVGLVAGTDLGGGNSRSDAEIVALATRSIRVNLNTTELNSIPTSIA